MIFEKNAKSSKGTKFYPRLAISELALPFNHLYHVHVWVDFMNNSTFDGQNIDFFNFPRQKIRLCPVTVAAPTIVSTVLWTSGKPSTWLPLGGPTQQESRQHHPEIIILIVIFH